MKPKAGEVGDPQAPNSVPAGLGIAKGTLDNVVVASFNGLDSVEWRFEEYPNQIAAVILEPIMMNVGMCMPQDHFLQGPREITSRNGCSSTGPWFPVPPT
jgi:glutamate-1-semialdehyde 2,1-aminomutase